jgi:hypothetical protein
MVGNPANEPDSAGADSLIVPLANSLLIVTVFERDEFPAGQVTKFLKHERKIAGSLEVRLLIERLGTVEVLAYGNKDRLCFLLLVSSFLLFWSHLSDIPVQATWPVCHATPDECAFGQSEWHLGVEPIGQICSLSC